MESGLLPESRKISIGQSLQRWLALLIEYFELRIRLLGMESKEAGLQVLSLALLLVSTLTLFAGFLVKSKWSFGGIGSRLRRPGRFSMLK